MKSTVFADNKKKKIITFAAVAAGALLITGVILIILLNSGEVKEAYRSIKIDRLQGIVKVANRSEEPYDAYETMHLYDGFTMSTGGESFSRMLLDEDKYIKLEENSLALFEGLKADSALTSIKLSYGSMTNEIVKPLSEDEEYVVTTPNAILSVRGTFFRAEVKFDEDGECFTEVYTYGGAVASRRIMPDGTVVDEDVIIDSGYKATVKMDEIITVYVEEQIEYGSDDVDPIDVPSVSDDDVVDMYVSSSNGHELFLTTNELADEIRGRDIDLTEYESYIDGEEIVLPEEELPEDEPEETEPEETEPEETEPEETEPEETEPEETEPEETQTEPAEEELFAGEDTTEGSQAAEPVVISLAPVYPPETTYAYTGPRIPAFPVTYPSGGEGISADTSVQPSAPDTSVSESAPDIQSDTSDDTGTSVSETTPTETTIPPETPETTVYTPETTVPHPVTTTFLPM